MMQHCKHIKCYWSKYVSAIKSIHLEGDISKKLPGEELVNGEYTE